MAIVCNPKKETNVLEVAVTGKLRREDYDRFAPEIERMVEKHGKIRVLLDMVGFQGWRDKEALWDETKFAWRHSADFSRIAMVGETGWEEWMSRLCRPFTSAEVRFYQRRQMSRARAWLAEPRKA
jgi:hypothetical protein